MEQLEDIKSNVQKESIKQTALEWTFILNLFIFLFFVFIAGLMVSSKGMGGIIYAGPSVLIGIYLLIVNSIYCFRHAVRFFKGQPATTRDKVKFIVSLSLIVFIIGAYILVRFFSS